MTSLYVDRRGVTLKADGEALVFYENGERIGTVPLAPLSRVFMRGDVTLSSALLGKLGERGIGVVVLSGRKAVPTMLLGRPHNDAARRVAQYRLSLDADFCLRFSRAIVEAKLRAQAGIPRRAPRQRAAVALSADAEPAATGDQHRGGRRTALDRLAARPRRRRCGGLLRGLRRPAARAPEVQWPQPPAAARSGERDALARLHAAARRGGAGAVRRRARSLHRLLSCARLRPRVAGLRPRRAAARRGRPARADALSLGEAAPRGFFDRPRAAACSARPGRARFYGEWEPLAARLRKLLAESVSDVARRSCRRGRSMRPARERSATTAMQPTDDGCLAAAERTMASDGRRWLS
jgi:CRISPR-associated protein Cas1